MGRKWRGGMRGGICTEITTEPDYRHAVKEREREVNWCINEAKQWASVLLRGRGLSWTFYLQMDGWMNWWTDGMTDTRMEGWKAGCMDTRMFGWMDGWMEGLNNTRIDG